MSRQQPARASAFNFLPGASGRKLNVLSKEHSALELEHHRLREAHDALLLANAEQDTRLTQQNLALQQELAINNTRLHRDRAEMQALQGASEKAKQLSLEVEEKDAELLAAKREQHQDRIKLERVQSELAAARDELHQALGVDEAERMSRAESRLAHEEKQAELGISVEDGLTMMTDLQRENRRLRQELVQARADMHKLESLRVEFIELSGLLLQAEPPKRMISQNLSGAADLQEPDR